MYGKAPPETLEIRMDPPCETHDILLYEKVGEFRSVGGSLLIREEDMNGGKRR